MRSLISAQSFRCRDAPIPRRLVDSRRIQDHWYPGEGQAPASVWGAGTKSHCRKSSLIPSQDMTSLDMQIHSVRFITKPTATWVGNLLKVIEEFLSSPDPPSCSLASSSGPPFVPYSSGKGWDVTDAICLDSPQVQVGLSRRVTSHLLGSSVSGGSFMVVLGDSTTRGSRSLSPSARLELLLGRVRRRLGRHRRGKTKCQEFGLQAKGNSPSNSGRWWQCRKAS